MKKIEKGEADGRNPPQEMVIWMNGQAVEASAATISVMDPAFLYGESLVTTVGVTSGRPEFLERHMNRILNMAEFLGWSHVPSRKAILDGVTGMIGILDRPPRLLRITMTPGVLSEVSMVKRPLLGGSWFIFPVFRPDPTSNDYEWGVDVEVPSQSLLLSGDPRGNLKTGNLLLSAMLARRRADGISEWLLKGEKGRLLEGAVSNVFFLRKDGVFLTAPERWGVLPGVIRSVVMEELKKAGTTLRWSAPTVSGLKGIREIFLTNSYLKVMPVGRLQDEKGKILWERSSGHPGMVSSLRGNVARRGEVE